MTTNTALQITRNNALVARAAGLAFGADGMVLARAMRPHLTCALILMATLVMLTLAKALLITLIGADAYGASVVVMQGGGLVDQAGAFLMCVDAVTRVLAGLMV